MWERIKHFLSTSGPPLVAYWMLTFYGLAAFSLVLVIEAGPEAALLLILMQLVGVTVVGQLFGHMLAYFRLRAPIVVFVFMFGCIIQTVTAQLVAAVPHLALIWFMAPFAIGSGFLAIRHRKEIFGAWIPLMYSVSASVILINIDASKLGAWKTGNKYAVWDFINLGIISGALLIFIIYMVTRQSQSLSMWQDITNRPRFAPNGERGLREGFAPRARISCLTWIIIGVLAGLLTLGTAAAAPFLFRTAPPEQGEGEKNQGEPKQEPKQEPEEDSQGDADLEKLMEGVQEMMKQGFNLLVMLLILLITLVLIYFIFWRPARRMATLRHLEKPAWPVPSTQRIKDLWRRALIALHDVKLEPLPTEAVTDMADRAHDALTQRFGAPPTGLREAAEIYAKVQYNIGVGPEDIVQMAAAVELLTDYIDNHLSAWDQVRNLYTGLKE